MPEMTVCPVCEHHQAAGDQCEVCGKRFSEAAEAVPVSAIEGLEPTVLGGMAVAEMESLAGLEPTVHPPAVVEGEGALEVVPDLEPTSSDPLAWEDRTPLLLAPLCRYCRTPANPGEVMCGRCGMQLPLVRPVAEDLPDDSLRCCPGCGTRSGREICPECGGRMPVSSGSPLAK